MGPSNPLELVRCLAEDEAKCEFFGVVLGELRRRKLDNDDLREIIRSDLGEIHCFDTKPTRKYYPNTASDYYSFWVDECKEYMFIKFLVVDIHLPTERLVVTSFKKDRNK